MKTKISTYLLIAGIFTSITACSSDEPVITDRNLDGSDLYYASSDQSNQDIYYKPAVGYVGDPMPFYDPVEGDFKVMYLQDFRPNQPLTYHPIWCVSTKDGASYTSLGELISCGAETELDAALGTGSTIYKDGVYYTFYTAHSPNPASTGGVNEAVMVATSTDFRTWSKNHSMLVTGGDEYSNNDFRDPFVFQGDDGLYHMLISTRKGGKGVLAEYTSTDLLNWQSVGVFMTMMWDRFYECPDVFKMGSWWYLVYSEQHDAIRRVQYFKAESLEGLKACTKDDAGLWPDDHEGFLDSRGLYAGKTASNGTDRYIWGWCATKAGSSNTGTPDWGGNLVAHKLIQHEDGTLTLGEIPAIASHLGEATTIAGFQLEGDSHKLLPRLGYSNRLSFRVTTGGASDRFGISFGRGSDSEQYYTVMINPESDTRRKINFEEEGGVGFIGNTDGYQFNAPADGVYDITIVTDNSVVTVYINDIASWTGRVYTTPRNCWSINSYGGNITISDIKVQKK